MRADHRAETEVGVAHIGHPVPHRLVDGVLERAAPRLDGVHVGTRQLHAEHVQLLARHVDRAHEHGALETHQRGGGGAGDAVLAGAGVGDDALLAHALGQQRLADDVVDLVRAGVVQVLTLEDQADPEPLAEVVALREDRRSSRVVVDGRGPARAGTRDRPTPRGMRPPAPDRPAPGSRARTDRRTRRIGRCRRVGRAANRRQVGVGPRSDGAHSKSQSYGMSSSSPRYCDGRGGPRILDEPLHGERVLAARRALDAGCHVDAPRLHLVDRRGHVLGGQSPGQDQLHAVGRVADERPVEDLAGTGFGSVDHHHVGAVPIGTGQVRVACAERLDDPAELLADLDALLGRLVTVQLHRLHARLVGQRRRPVRATRCGTPRPSGSPAGADG